MGVYNPENIICLAIGIGATILIIKRILIMLDQKENK